MPICVNCSSSVPVLYTQYESAYNLRLEQCSACHAFADPYVEHDTLNLVIDLILLKKAVFIHLIYNKDSEPRRAVSNKAEPAVPAPSRSVREREEAEEWYRYQTTAELGIGLVLLDALIRCSSAGLFSSDASSGSCAQQFAIMLFRCAGETIVFHATVVCASYLLLPTIDRDRRDLQVAAIFAGHGHSTDYGYGPSDIEKQFKLSHIPLTIFYSSLTKFFLLSLLSIWYTSHPPESVPPTSSSEAYSILHAIWTMFDETVLDRDWAVRNVLGGMAAGFGLGVVLDCHSMYVTVIIGFGWIAKVIFAGFVSEVTAFGEAAWMKYSIP